MVGYLVVLFIAVTFAVTSSATISTEKSYENISIRRTIIVAIFLLIAISCSLSIGELIGEKNIINGKVKYELVTHPDSTRTLERIVVNSGEKNE
ncbi:MAG: hypothetical protein M0R03_21415 [Novosphingobium sp.]|jgi:hypothetical protein|nr:hypothetical protein [Novosphingobium sp.]